MARRGRWRWGPCPGRARSAIRVARGSLNSGLSVYAGRAPASNRWKSRLRAVSHCAVAGRVVDDHRRIDATRHSSAVTVRLRLDACVIAARRRRAPAARRRRWPRRRCGFFAPCEIEPNEVHRTSLRTRAVSCVSVTIPNVLANRYASDDSGDLVTGGQGRRRTPALAGGVAGAV